MSTGHGSARPGARRLAALVVALAASCGGEAGHAGNRLALYVRAGATRVEYGRAFALAVTRTWPRGWIPSVWDERALAPLVLRPVDAARRETGAFIEETRTYRAYAFAPGRLEIAGPVLRARPRGGGTERSVRADPLALDVRPALDAQRPGAPEMAGGPLPAPFPLGLWIAGALALAAGAAVLVLRSRRRVPSEPEPPPPAPAPHESTLAALAQLRKSAPSTGAELAAFYVEASRIVREYAGARFGLDAGVLTTEELALAAGAPRLERFLLHCDGVKFARRRPGADERARMLDEAVRFVEEAAG